MFFITFNQYQKTFHLSYCASLYHKVDIFIVRNFSIIFDFGFVPSVSKTLISLLFINIFAPNFFWLEINIFFKYPESFNFLGLTVLKSVMGWKKWKILENVFFAFLCNFRYFFSLVFPKNKVFQQISGIKISCIWFRIYLAFQQKKLHVNRIYSFGYSDPNVGGGVKFTPPCQFLDFF